MENLKQQTWKEKKPISNIILYIENNLIGYSSVQYSSEYEKMLRENNVKKVGAGSMEISDKDGILMTEGLSGCIAIFISGEKGNALVHATAGNSGNFPYKIDEDYPNYDPQEQLIVKILENTESLGDQSNFNITIVQNTSNFKNLMSEVNRLAENFKRTGISTKIITNDTDDMVTIFIPNEKKLITIGSKRKLGDSEIQNKEYNLN